MTTTAIRPVLAAVTATDLPEQPGAVVLHRVEAVRTPHVVTLTGLPSTWSRWSAAGMARLDTAVAREHGVHGQRAAA